MDLKELSNGEYFHYRISDGGHGLVKADSREEAIDKVLDAYNAHGQCLTLDDISINVIEQNPFTDAPDVLEIYAY